MEGEGFSTDPLPKTHFFPRAMLSSSTRSSSTSIERGEGNLNLRGGGGTLKGNKLGEGNPTKCLVESSTWEDEIFLGVIAAPQRANAKCCILAMPFPKSQHLASWEGRATIGTTNHKSLITMLPFSTPPLKRKKMQESPEQCVAASDTQCKKHSRTHAFQNRCICATKDESFEITRRQLGCLFEWHVMTHGTLHPTTFLVNQWRFPKTRAADYRADKNCYRIEALEVWICICNWMRTRESVSAFSMISLGSIALTSENGVFVHKLALRVECSIEAFDLFHWVQLCWI